MAINIYDQMNYAQYNPMQTVPMMTELAKGLRAEEDRLSEDYVTQQGLLGQAASKLITGVDDAEIALLKAQQDEINMAAEDLATKGFIDAGRRRSLLAAKGRYASEVLPMEDAIRRREESAKMHQQLKAKDQTYEYADPYKTSLASYREGASGSAGISGNVLGTQVAQVAASLGKGQFESGLGKNLMPYQREYIQQTGFKPSDIQEAINSERTGQVAESTGGRILQQVLKDTLNASGAVDTFGQDSAEYSRLFENAARGLYAGIGETKATPISDQFGMAVAKSELDLRNKMRYKQWEDDLQQPRSRQSIFGTDSFSGRPYDTEMAKTKLPTMIRNILSGKESLDVDMSEAAIKKRAFEANRGSGMPEGVYNRFKKEELERDKVRKIVKSEVDDLMSQGMTKEQALQKIALDPESHYQKYSKGQDSYSSIQATIEPQLKSNFMTSMHGKNVYDASGNPVEIEKVLKERGWNMQQYREWLKDNASISYNNMTGRAGIPIPTVEFDSNGKMKEFGDVEMYQTDFDTGTAVVSKALGIVNKALMDKKYNEDIPLLMGSTATIISDDKIEVKAPDGRSMGVMTMNKFRNNISDIISKHLAGESVRLDDLTKPERENLYNYN